MFNNNNSSDYQNNNKFDQRYQDQIEVVFNYWKNFDIKTLQRTLNSHLNELTQRHVENDELNKKYSELNREIKKSFSDETQKAVFPLLKLFQCELDNLIKRAKFNETSFLDLNKVLSNIPDPLPMIELAINIHNEYSEKIDKYENENKQLRDALEEYASTSNDYNNQNKKTSQEDKELIRQLYEQISKTTNMNLDLTAKLEVAENEIESYKKILNNYQNEISDLKIKFLNNETNSHTGSSSSSGSASGGGATATTGSNNRNLIENDKFKRLFNATNSIQNSLLQQQLQNRSTGGIVQQNFRFHHTTVDDLKVNSGSRLPPLSDSNTQSAATSLFNNRNRSTTPTATAAAASLTPLQSASMTLKALLTREKLLKSQNQTDNTNDYSEYSSTSPSTCSTQAQQQVQVNLDALNSEPLDTTEISVKVRELLNVHNIGQRVFAKYVLGLSQGTVSELLSKPKHWDKLTEKGRESYRKMYTWSCSSDSINALKAMSPRKGNKDTYFYQNGAKEDTATEERIVQILNEAQKQMQAKTTDENKSQLCVNSNGDDDDDEDVNDENVDNEVCGGGDGDSVNEYNQDETDPNSNQSDTASPSNQTPKAYHPLDLTVKTPITGLTNNDMLFNRGATPTSSTLKRQHSFDSSYNNNCDEENLNRNKKLAIDRPLLQMQSIANSFLTNNNNNSNEFVNQTHLNILNSIKDRTNNHLSQHHQQQQQPQQSKPLKSILPPVSQEQFDKYSFINTDDLVRRVKDLLSKYSISQRLFGEYILGLSQGSVSDLLARPKPWIMLTQKGREPFIRMQIFIDDSNAIKKLMANQYKVPQDKLATTQQQQQQQQQRPFNTSISSQLNYLHYSTNNGNPSSNFSSSSSTHTHNNDNSNDDLETMKQAFQPQLNIIPYDISTMTSTINDLNTEEITNRVKETLLNNNIGQKLFGEAVLNLSQGTVSELLSKPKPWNTLSIKGREPYLRMYMWLNDVCRLEKLNDWKEEKNLIKRNNAEIENDQQKPKRRFIFTEEQKEHLMKAFRVDPYPSVNTMEFLAGMLNLETRTVINWFHNHRMRIRYKNTAQQQQQQLVNQSYNPTANSLNSKYDIASLIQQQQKLKQNGAYRRLNRFDAGSILNGANSLVNKTNGNNQNYTNNYELDDMDDGGNMNDLIGDEDEEHDLDNDDDDDGYCENNENISNRSVEQHEYDQNSQNNEMSYQNQNSDYEELDEDIDEDDEDDDVNRKQNEINSLFLDDNQNNEDVAVASSAPPTATTTTTQNVDFQLEDDDIQQQINRANHLNRTTTSNKRRKPDNPQRISNKLNNNNSLINNSQNENDYIDDSTAKYLESNNSVAINV